jgi:hypothetical protein
VGPTQEADAGGQLGRRQLRSARPCARPASGCALRGEQQLRALWDGLGLEEREAVAKELGAEEE